MPNAVSSTTHFTDTSSIILLEIDCMQPNNFIHDTVMILLLHTIIIIIIIEKCLQVEIRHNRILQNEKHRNNFKASYRSMYLLYRMLESCRERSIMS